MFTSARTKSRLRISMISISIIFLFSILLISNVEAYTIVRTEDFDNVDFVEEVVTNVTGWGSGEISLPRTNLTLLSSVETDSVKEIQVDGDLAYIFGGDYFSIYNVSNSNNPQFIDSIYIGPDYTTGQGTVVAGYAYISTHTPYCVRIFNVTDPTMIDEIAQYPLKSRDVFVDGDYLYVPGDEYGLHIVNISNPASPTFISNITEPLYQARTVIKDGNFVYLLSSEGVSVPSILDIINVTDIHHPSQVCRLSNWGWGANVNGFSIEGDILAFGSHNFTGNGVLLYDLTDIMNPSLITRIPSLSENVNGIVGTTLFTTKEAIDITDPENPFTIIEFPDNGYRRTTISGNHIFAATFDGFQILEYSDNLNPSLISYSSIEGRDICVTGTTAFIAVDSMGLQSIDVIDPTDIGSQDFVDLVNIRKIFVMGTTAFVTEYDGLRIFDVRDSASISQLGYIAGLTAAEGLSVVDNFAYVVDSSGLTVINVTDLQNPTACGSYSTPSETLGVWSDGRYAYLAAGENGLIIVNVTNPRHPAWIASIDTLGTAKDIDVAGPHAFIADSDSGVKIFSITIPSNPRLIGSYNTPGSALEVYASGDELYVADDTSGVIILNITTPQNPTFFDSQSVSSNSLALCADLEYVYSIGEGGFDVIHARYARGRDYVPYAIAQSDTLFTAKYAEQITRVVLHANDTQPADTDINYFVSSDDGEHWTEVVPNILETISPSRQDLRWKVELSKSSFNVTPTIYSIDLTCAVQIAYLIGQSPRNQVIENATPTFTWVWPPSVDEDYSSYNTFLFHLDTSDQFDTSDFINTTIVIGEDYSYTLTTPLEDGIWYWRIAGIDQDGQAGLFSAVYTFTLDTTANTTGGLLGELPVIIVVAVAGGVALIIFAFVWNKRRSPSS